MLAPAFEPEGMVGDGAWQIDANTGFMLAPAFEPEGMVGDGAWQVDANSRFMLPPTFETTGMDGDRAGQVNANTGFMVAPAFQSEDTVGDGAGPLDANTGFMLAPNFELEGMVGDGAGQVGANTRFLLATTFEPEGMVGDGAGQVDANSGFMLSPAFEPEGMVGDGAGQVDVDIGSLLAPAFEPEGMVGDRANRDGAKKVDTSASTAGVSDNKSRKNRSEVRKYFHITPAVNGERAWAKCLDCGTQVDFSHGTSVLHKHRKSANCKKKRAAIEEAPNGISFGDRVQNGAIISANASEGTKRMRSKGNVPTTTTPWDKTNILERIHKIALDLENIRGYVEHLKNNVTSSDQYHSNTSDTRVRTSGSRPQKLYGRDTEKDHIMRVFKAAKSDIITVIPIVGIVGVGKTALAKLVYNDRLVKDQFKRIWVWVSNILIDEARVTREILDVVTLDRHEGSPHNRESYGVSNYKKLQEVLKNHMTSWSKKFLLVLDDVNDCMDDSRWKDLLDALASSCTKGNVIIVTTRNLSIAQRLGTVEPVKLRALEDNDFWLLFKAYAFGDNNNNKKHLDIGYQIAMKLKGNPLAAESAAEMLREQPTLEHWKSIIHNGIWQSLQLRGGIVDTLKIIYYQLHYQLQQCFLFCSIFPSNHQFHMDDLVSMWISLGFVKSIEIGRDYFNALVNSCLLEQVKTKDSIVLITKCYVICGMMHAFARLISRTEFATIDGLECEVLPTVRHFSILTDLVYHKDECGTIVHNVKFEEKMQSIASSVRRLRTLILIGYNSLIFELQSLHTFISNSENCTHLRYLKLENKGCSEALPISLSKFYHLEALDVGCQTIVHDMRDLISMRHLVLTKGACGGSASFPAWFACVHEISLEGCEGWEILPSLKRLSFLTKLKLRNMLQVTELSIPLLEELVLIDMPKLNRCFSSSVRNLNFSLRVLEIRRCWLLKTFPLFEKCKDFEIEQKSWLPNVRELTIHGCPYLTVSNALPPSSSFCKLFIKDVSTLPTMEGSSKEELKIGPYDGPSIIDILDNKILSFHNLRTITRLHIMGFKNVLSISIEGFKQLICLKRLEIWSCKKIFSSDVPSMPSHEDMAATNLDSLPSLDFLSIIGCGITGQWLSVILQHVGALEKLHLHSCEQITGLLIAGKENSLSNLTSAPRALSQGNSDAALIRSCPDKLLRIPSNLVTSLKKISIECCELKFLGNKKSLSRFTSLEELIIFECPELVSSFVHEDKIDDQGRFLLPCSLSLLEINDASLAMLQPCFPGDMISLTVLKVSRISELKSLQLHSCTTLEKLKIEECELLDTLEGVQSLRNLRHLKVYRCPGLPQCLKSLSMQGYELCPRLESLQINDYSFLTVPFCKQLTTLQCLQFKNCWYIAVGLTDEQAAALQLLTSLQQLRFDSWYKLTDLPVGLHSLPYLKQLQINYCPDISGLPERGLPPSMEELVVYKCSKKLSEECRNLATSKLKVIIDGNHVN